MAIFETTYKPVSLRLFLNQLQKKYHHAEYLSSDPLYYVHSYTHPWDQEAVALISAMLAYGRVAQIKNSIQLALKLMLSMSKSPRTFVRSLNESRFFQKKAFQAFSQWKHRFNTGEDLVQLLLLLGRSWQKYGSLAQHFLSFLKPQDTHIGFAFNSFILELKNQTSSSKKSFQYFLTAPQDGSCCKRWCMFLRWMGRSDELDPGLWTKKSPLVAKSHLSLQSSQLILPLDTHTARITQYLGLRKEKTINWQTALEVTENLKKLDKEDPTRYDFSLSRLGILKICKQTYREEICESCELFPGCQLAQKSKNLKIS